MYRKEFSIFALLLIAMFVFAGCGSSGSSTALNTATDLGKTAKAELAFDFPKGEVGTALLSDATTHILVNVKQWTTDGMNNLTVVNTDKALLTKASPTATIDLFPTYTRICASQYKGDPNDYVTSSTLETACTFGKLIPGTNTVNLTMLRGTWKLGTAYNNISEVALARIPGSTSYYEGLDYGTDVMDGLPSGDNVDPFTSGISCYNNWGCLYQTMFKQAGAWQFLTYQEGFSASGYSNTFNAPNLLIGALEDMMVEVIGDGIGDDDGNCEVNEQCDKVMKSAFAIGGVSGTVGATVYTEQKDIIAFAPYQSSSYQSGQDCWYSSNGYYGYICSKPVLYTLKNVMKIESTSDMKTYTDVTGTKVNPCKMTITGGNSITGCGLKNTDFIPGTLTSHNFRTTFTNTVSGANICYWEEGGAEKDATGAIKCYDYHYDYYWDGTQYVSNCYNGGTYNSQTQRCENTLSDVCTQDGGTYNATTETCTRTSLDYATTLNTPTSVTLTGAGSLPAGLSTTTN